jgi:hypothetical protein
LKNHGGSLLPYRTSVIHPEPENSGNCGVAKNFGLEYLPFSKVVC